jgi:hypothetical protein
MNSTVRNTELYASDLCVWGGGKEGLVKKFQGSVIAGDMCRQPNSGVAHYNRPVINHFR